MINCIHMSVNPSVISSLSNCTSIRPSIYPSAFNQTNLSFHLSILLVFHHFMQPSVCHTICPLISKRFVSLAIHDQFNQPFLPQSISLFVCPSISSSVSIHISLYPPYLTVNLTIHPIIHTLIYHWIFPSVHSSINHLSIWPFVQQSVYQSFLKVRSHCLKCGM